MNSTIYKLIGFFFLLAVSIAHADPICGDPPPVANEILEGEIAGKAQLLTRFIGDAQLSGKIETSRTEIFSKYPDAEKSRANAFFEYQVCVLIMNDKSLGTMQKLDELKKIKREFPKPLSSLDEKSLAALSTAESDCLDAKFSKAQAALRNLAATFPGESTVQSALSKCTELSEVPMSINVTLEVGPAVFMYDEGDDTYLARFMLEIDDSYCGSLSNLNGQESVSCNSLPGLRSFKLRSISLYSPFKENIFRGGNCAGSFIVKPSVDRYGIVMCLKEPYISCKIEPLDEEFYNFTHDKCRFKS